MKRVFSFLLIIAILCTLSVPCFAANPVVTATADKTSANIGDIITVTVKLSANSNLGGIGVGVLYDKNDFEYVTNSIKGAGAFDMEQTKDETSIVYLGVSSNAINSAATLFTVKFKVKSYGGDISLLAIDAVGSDNSDATSTVKTKGVKITCAHGNAQWKVTKQATCTTKGSETRTCPCGDVSTRDIPLKEHTVGTYKTTKEATCTEKGKQLAICSICAKEFTKEIATLNHNFGEWTIVKEATETEKGTKERICKVCDKKETAEIPMIFVSETLSETQTQLETQTENEVTTIPQNQDTNETDAKPIVIGAIFFIVGIAVGIGATLFIIKRKAKEEE